MQPHEATIRVRYAETDQMGVVYHANYLIWMEVGRVEYCRAAGLVYRDLEQEDAIRLAVVGVQVRYLSPARYDDEVTVKVTVAEAGPRMIVFAYEMTLASTGQILATGETKHIFLGASLKPCKLPAKYHSAFGIT
jgi:acyl-CoA thioester hydrolase